MKFLIAATFILCSLFVRAQKSEKTITAPKDSIVIIQLSREDYAVLEQAINANIDSKTVTKQLIEFLRTRALLVPKPEAKK